MTCAPPACRNDGSARYRVVKGAVFWTYSVYGSAIVHRLDGYIVGKGNGDVDVALLHNVYLGSEVSRLGLLIRREGFYVGSDEKIVCQIVKLRLGYVGLLVDVSMDSYVPSFLGPVGICTRERVRRR